MPPTGAPTEAPLGLVLSCHGASVPAMNQARAYARKDDFAIVAALNRRPYGFDWQDWGRRDAYEVLERGVALSGVSRDRLYLLGHSMGGHGALTLALKNPDRFRSVSAFAPICHPVDVPWGTKAFSNYLGDDRAAWAAHDATELVKTKPTGHHILIDQGEADQFLAEQLRPEAFAAACDAAGQRCTLRMQPGYDHSYFFISSFMEDHIRFHCEQLA